ncbi:RNA-guided endonuclease InsQ/TnpB family protein [Kribbella sp. NPDC049174]|uniref:RNA-guided endonuclease InsQ/TnpB family protein n=1 Tax=Kribbella sp. NPDC049174 TaxID=3364112 RepID=UPI0037231C34
MSRYRLAPTPAQVAALLEQCGHARFVWNLALEQWSMWRPGRRSHAPRFVAQARQLTEARANNDWLRAGSQMVQQQALRDFDQAVTRFFAGINRRPTWRKAGRHEGFRIVGAQASRTERLSRRWGRVLVPKVGWIRFRLSRPLPEAKSYRVTRDRAGRWHVAFAVAPDPIPAPANGDVVGVDRGVIVSAALSTGELLYCPRLRPGEKSRLLRLQRRLSKAQHGSNRRARIVAAIAHLKARETDRRKDWVEQTSTDLARRFDVIRVEDLRIRKLTRSAKGTVAEPGKNVRQKAGLNRGILANGWGCLVERLEHKAVGRVEKVVPAYTSQTCSRCGTKDRKARENQADFRCPSCGYIANADVNAATNIAAGRAVTARGADGVRSAAKREPQLATSASMSWNPRPSGRGGRQAMSS